ncbi:MAG: hypothetical protein QXO27_04220 [Candidatus Aenigmatarchaeota archaeon]
MSEPLRIEIENKKKINLEKLKKELVKRGFTLEENIHENDPTLKVKGICCAIDPCYFLNSSYHKISNDTEIPTVLLLSIHFSAFVKYEFGENMPSELNMDFIRNLNNLVTSICNIVGVDFVCAKTTPGNIVGGFYYKDNRFKKVIEYIRFGLVKREKITKEDLTDESIKRLISKIPGFNEKVNGMNCLWFVKAGTTGAGHYPDFLLYNFISKQYGGYKK